MGGGGKREKGRKRHGGRRWERESGPWTCKGCAEGAAHASARKQAKEHKILKRYFIKSRNFWGKKPPSSPVLPRPWRVRRQGAVQNVGDGRAANKRICRARLRSAPCRSRSVCPRRVVGDHVPLPAPLGWWRAATSSPMTRSNLSLLHLISNLFSSSLSNSLSLPPALPLPRSLSLSLSNLNTRPHCDNRVC